MAPLMRLPPEVREIRFRIYPVLFGWYDSERGEESLKYLGKLVERAAQSASNARITITSTNREPLHPKCQSTADAVLERLQRQREYQRRLSSGLLPKLSIDT